MLRARVLQEGLGLLGAGLGGWLLSHTAPCLCTGRAPSLECRLSQKLPVGWRVQAATLPPLLPRASLALGLGLLTARPSSEVRQACIPIPTPPLA